MVAENPLEFLIPWKHFGQFCDLVCEVRSDGKGEPRPIVERLEVYDPLRQDYVLMMSRNVEMFRSYFISAHDYMIINCT